MSYEHDLKEISFKFKPKQMAALPGVTKKDREIIRYNNVDFYTNETLRQKFIISLMKHTPAKSHKVIEKMINQKVLIPAFMTKSTFQWYVKNKLDPEQDNKFGGVLGFYIPNAKKIFVLIDAGYKVLGWVPDAHLAAVTLHECMHMAAKIDPRKFLRINIKPYFEFYSEFLKFVYNTKAVNREAVVEWVTYIHSFEIGKGKLNKDEYSKRMVAAIKEYTKLSEKDIQDRNNYIWSYVAGTFGSSGNQQMNVIRKYRNVYVALMQSYKKAFGFQARTLAYQEMFTPSEVICILASMELGKNRYVSDSLDIIV